MFLGTPFYRFKLQKDQKSWWSRFPEYGNSDSRFGPVGEGVSKWDGVSGVV